MEVTAPGFDTGTGAPADEERYQLVIETANTTGWEQLKRRLESTTAGVLLAQETWILQSAVPAASAWARARGWRSVWAPAAVTKKGGTSAGVAVFARDYMGLHPMPGRSHIVHPARAVAAVLEAPGQREALLMSCYLKHGRKAAGINAAILSDIEDEINSQGEEGVCIVGGDMNMEPHELLATELDRNVGATVLYPPTPRGTFRTSRAASTLDYFLVSDRLAAAVEGIATVEASGAKGHVPVHLTFKPRLAALKALHLRMPPKLELDRVYGPIPPPPGWEAQRATAQAALAAARSGHPCTDELMEAAYAAWVDNAEVEIENVTGVPLKKRGVRAQRPRLVWRSVLPERRANGPQFSAPAAFTWLRDIVGELQRISAVASAAAARQRSDNDGGTAASGCTPRNGASGNDDVEDSDDERDAPDDGGYAHNPPGTDADGDHGPPTSWTRCARISEGIVTALEDDLPPGTLTEEFSRRLEQVIVLANGMAEACTQDGATPGQPAATETELHAEVARPWPRGAALATAAWANELDAIRAELDALVKATDAKTKAEQAARWRAWLREDIDSGASRAHAYTRLPQEVVAAAAEIPGGGFSSAPTALLEEQRRKYCRLWKPAPAPYRYDWGPAEELPMLTVDQLREASQSFKRRTAQTFDGLHPRHFASLSDDALAVLATLLQAVEVAGMWPRQLRLVVTALLPKPKGGFRPIGIMPALYRLWAKARRPWADAWEERHHRGYLSSARGNGPTDTLWRIGARQEAGTAAGEQAGVIADDLSAFFETVGREQLVREARETGYPIPLLKGALATYSAARMLTMQGRVARETFPTVGVIAGCSLAMSLTKVFYLRALDRLAVALPPTVSLDVHVDDVTLSAVGPPPAIVPDLVAARVLLLDVLDHIGCSVAPDKTAVTATTRKIAAEIARRVGVPTAVTSTPCILGIDNTAGARRARLGTTSKKAARLRNALARRRRLGQVQRAVGGKARRVFRAGLLPAATYDAPIWGMAQAEVLRLRRLAATTMSPRAPGRSLSMVTLWHGHPTADAEAAPVVHYAKMVWKAVVRRDDARLRGSSLADLRAWWEAAQIYAGPLAEQALAARGADGRIPHKTAKKLWSEVKGPIGAAALTLATVGWRFGSALSLVDPRGEEHPLTSTSPAMVRHQMRGALRDCLERVVGASFAGRSAAYQGRRACLDLAIKASRPGRRITPHQAAAFRAVACGAVWTAQKARERGYDCDGQCTMCHGAADTIDHRVYECPHTRDAVEAAVPAWFWREAQRDRSRSPFWTTAIMPHPADLAPAPRGGMYCEVERHHEEDAQGREQGDLMRVFGRTYVDGSCKPSPIRGLARASCSLVVYGDGSAPVKTISMPVPPHLPQTAQAGENLGMALGYLHASGPTDLVGDCLGVVRAFSSAALKILAPSRKYAGLALAAFRPRPKGEVTARWTKAHRTLNGQETEEELRDFRGNDAADKAAKEAIQLHPQRGADLDADIAYYEKRAHHVICAVTAAMALFPPAPSNMNRAPRPASTEEARRVRRHHWRFAAGAWRCTACNAYTTAKTVPRYRLRQRCDGSGMAGAAAEYAASGHTLVRTDGQLPIVLCTCCGAWGNKRTRKLGQRCAAPTPAGRQAIKRLAAGWHPALQLGTDGLPRPRARATITAAYDPVSGLWKPVDAPAERRPAAEAADEMPVDIHDAEVETGCDHGGGPADADVDMPQALDPVFAHMEEDAEDVFGHGGSLDEPPSELAAAGDTGGDVTMPGAGIEGTARLAQLTPVAPCRRRRAEEHCTPVDFTGRAVRLLGESLARRDADAAGRMQRLRRRIQEKERASETAARLHAEEERHRSRDPLLDHHGTYGEASCGGVARTRTGGIKRPRREDRSAHSDEDRPEHRAPRQPAVREHLRPALSPARRGHPEHAQRPADVGLDERQRRDHGGDSAGPRPAVGRVIVDGSVVNPPIDARSNGRERVGIPRDGAAGIGGADAPEQPRASGCHRGPGGADSSSLRAADDACLPGLPGPRPATRAELVAALACIPQRKPAGNAPVEPCDHGRQPPQRLPGARQTPTAAAEPTGQEAGGRAAGNPHLQLVAFDAAPVAIAAAPRMYSALATAASSGAHGQTVYSTAAPTSAAAREGSGECRVAAAVSSEARSVLPHFPADAGKRGRATSASREGEPAAIRRRIRGKQPLRHAAANSACPVAELPLFPQSQLTAEPTAQPAPVPTCDGRQRPGRPPDGH